MFCLRLRLQLQLQLQGLGQLPTVWRSAEDVLKLEVQTGAVWLEIFAITSSASETP